MKRNLFFTICLFLIIFFSLNNVFANVFPAASIENNFAAVGCSIAPVHSTPKNAFCPGFNTVAICGCRAEGLPYRICSQGAKTIYTTYIQPLGGVAVACTLHRPIGVTRQECIDQWNCYLSGTDGNPSDHECFGQANVSGC